MAERAHARRKRHWLTVTLGSLLLGTVGAGAAWLIDGSPGHDNAAASSIDALAELPPSSAPKWGRIVPVAPAVATAPEATTADTKSRITLDVSLPAARAAALPSHTDDIEIAAPSTLPATQVALADEPAIKPDVETAALAASTSRLEPLELPDRDDTAIASSRSATGATPKALATAPDAITAGGPDRKLANDELTLLKSPVKFPARETDLGKSAKLKLGFGPGAGRKPVQVKVKRGDSLYGILKSKGLSAGVLPALLSVGKHGDRLKRIRPGQALEFYIDAKGQLERLDYRPDALTTVSYRRDGSGFASALEETPLDKRERSVSGVIESSLFLDGQRAGLSNRIIMQMAEIFGWDVDFALDLRDGDRFTVIYEELHKDGRKFRDGDILAAEFINRGRVFRAVRFVTPTGETEYYTPKGRSMRKAFLRTPVRFARISSRFNLRRKHPVLHKVRAHRGVDYAAPVGTPVKATGAGRIEFVGRKGGYGKTIIIRHTGGVYSTLYAHMNGFAKKLHTGSAVRQGQTIGYVGKTGLATGPHLHYEFRVRGRHKDPLRVRLPKSLPIATKHKRAFQRQTRKFIARLNSTGATVAQND